MNCVKVFDSIHSQRVNDYSFVRLVFQTPSLQDH